MKTVHAFGSNNIRNEPDKIIALNQRREEKKDFGSKNLQTKPDKILPRINHNTKRRGRSCLQNIHLPLYKIEQNMY
jgi:hypothetical protein